MHIVYAARSCKRKAARPSSSTQAAVDRASRVFSLISSGLSPTGASADLESCVAASFRSSVRAAYCFGRFTSSQSFT